MTMDNIKDNIKTVVREIGWGCMDGIHMAEGRDHC
jgi:hypothetical protein